MNKLYPIWKVDSKRYKHSIAGHTYFDSKERAEAFIENQKKYWSDWIYSKPEYIGSFKKENAEILLGYQIEE